MRKRIVMITIVIIAILIPLIAVSALKVYDFTDNEVRILRVPFEWGEPINVAGGRGRIIVMFEDGHIIVLGQWLSQNTYTYKIERVK